MGVYNGTDVKVIKNSGHGALILEADGAELVIGRGQARKILVEKI